MTKKELGMNLFKQGYNCAQSVAGAFANEMSMSVEEAVKIASPFGGGMGRMREVCGAVSGMFMVLGRLEGYDQVDREKQKALYEKVNILADKFKAETGSIICKELLGLTKKENDLTPEKRDENYYKKRPCVELVGLACEILEDYLGSK
ncbi:MAG: C_GCAxxG_C_C family protein [Abditibacteriota bacterium]|nr:C_GCAxxG_C_C family protein [Abditibacteriota bacterium]